MLYFLPALLAAAAVMWAMWLALIRRFRRQALVVSPRPAGRPDPDRGSRVTVILSAKDEEAHLGACLESLLAQDDPGLRFIVVDDRSADRTAAIVSEHAARDHRLTLLHNADLPAGWTGKCHALSIAAPLADSEWLLFTDADTRHRAGSIASAVALAEARQVDLLSLLPAVRVEGLWARVLTPCLAAVFLSLFPPPLANDPRCRLAFANGQFLLIRREVYDRLGGHTAVRGDLLEDVALARLAKRAGARVCVADGTAVLEADMYGGLSAIWRGWSRLFYGSGRPAAMLLLWIVLLLAGTVMPALVLAAAAGGAALGLGGWLLRLILALACVPVTLMMLCMGSVHRRSGWRLRDVLFYPLAAVAAVALLANAVRLRLFAGRLTWRGTTYDLGRLARWRPAAGQVHVATGGAGQRQPPPGPPGRDRPPPG